MRTHYPGPWDWGGPLRPGHTHRPLLMDKVGNWILSVEVGAAEVEAVLIRAAPAYEIAWSMVPKEIKDRIFDALHKPDTEWVEDAIHKSEAHQRG